MAIYHNIKGLVVVVTASLVISLFYQNCAQQFAAECAEGDTECEAEKEYEAKYNLDPKTRQPKSLNQGAYVGNYATSNRYSTPTMSYGGGSSTGAGFTPGVGGGNFGGGSSGSGSGSGGSSGTPGLAGGGGASGLSGGTMDNGVELVGNTFKQQDKCARDSFRTCSDANRGPNHRKFGFEFEKVPVDSLDVREFAIVGLQVEAVNFNTFVTYQWYQVVDEPDIFKTTLVSGTDDNGNETAQYKTQVEVKGRPDIAMTTDDGNSQKFSVHGYYKNGVKNEDEWEHGLYYKEGSANKVSFYATAKNGTKGQTIQSNAIVLKIVKNNIPCDASVAYTYDKDSDGIQVANSDKMFNPWQPRGKDATKADYEQWLVPKMGQGASSNSNVPTYRLRAITGTSIPSYADDEILSVVDLSGGSCRPSPPFITYFDTFGNSNLQNLAPARHVTLTTRNFHYKSDGTFTRVYQCNQAGQVKVQCRGGRLKVINPGEAACNCVFTSDRLVLANEVVPTTLAALKPEKSILKNNPYAQKGEYGEKYGPIRTVINAGTADYHPDEVVLRFNCHAYEKNGNCARTSSDSSQLAGFHIQRVKVKDLATDDVIAVNIQLASGKVSTRSAYVDVVKGQFYHGPNKTEPRIRIRTSHSPVKPTTKGLTVQDLSHEYFSGPTNVEKTEDRALPHVYYPPIREEETRPDSTTNQEAFDEYGILFTELKDGQSGKACIANDDLDKAHFPYIFIRRSATTATNAIFELSRKKKNELSNGAKLYFLEKELIITNVNGGTKKSGTYSCVNYKVVGVINGFDE